MPLIPLYASKSSPTETCLAASEFLAQFTAEFIRHATHLLEPNDRAALKRELRNLLLFRVLGGMTQHLEIVSHQGYCEALHRMRDSQDLQDAARAEESRTVISIFEMALRRAHGKYGIVLPQLLARRKSSFAIHQVLAFLLGVTPKIWDRLPEAAYLTCFRSLRLTAQ